MEEENHLIQSVNIERKVNMDKSEKKHAFLAKKCVFLGDLAVFH